MNISDKLVTSLLYLCMYNCDSVSSKDSLTDTLCKQLFKSSKRRLKVKSMFS